jgi:uncharacterized protein YneF (UPF0154 family)
MLDVDEDALYEGNSWAEMRLISTTVALLGGVAIVFAITQRKLSKLMKKNVMVG